MVEARPRFRKLESVQIRETPIMGVLCASRYGNDLYQSKCDCFFSFPYYVSDIDEASQSGTDK